MQHFIIKYFVPPCFLVSIGGHCAVVTQPIMHSSLCHLYVSFRGHCQLNLTVTSSHFYHHTKAMLYHPNVCSTLVKPPKQTFSVPQSPCRASSTGLVPSDVTPIRLLPLVGPSNSVFFSTHSSYRLDKINSDMRNYITNFAADLR